MMPPGAVFHTKRTIQLINYISRNRTTSAAKCGVSNKFCLYAKEIFMLLFTIEIQYAIIMI